MPEHDATADYETKPIALRGILARRAAPFAIAEAVGLMAGVGILVMKPAWSSAAWTLIGVSVALGATFTFRGVRNVPCPDCGEIMARDVQRRALRCDRCRILWSPRR